jgi:hypothetical protein
MQFRPSDIVANGGTIRVVVHHGGSTMWVREPGSTKQSVAVDPARWTLIKRSV